MLIALGYLNVSWKFSHTLLFKIKNVLEINKFNEELINLNWIQNCIINKIDQIILCTK